MVRKNSNEHYDRINHIINSIHLYFGDLTDSLSIINIIKKVEPDEIYNLAAQSNIQISFEEPEYTSNVNALGVLRIIEAVRILGLNNKTKISSINI